MNLATSFWHRGINTGLLLVVFLLCQPVSSQPSFEVAEAGIAELQQALESGRVTSVQLVDQYLARIEAYDQSGPVLNSVIRLHPAARQRAAELDEERERNGPRSLLHGVPILVKDNYNTADMPTTNGTVALANFMPGSNATQVQKLLDAGAIILAKTTLHEYARGITTISSLSGQTRNPYDIRRVPGGSSGGTGAGVAASFAAIGLGSDTCGSIRIPSAFNNLFGLRPTKGLSSIHGIAPLSHTQDVAGPLARSLDDLAILLDVVVGYDTNDPATEVMQDRSHPRFRDNLGSGTLEGLRLGKLSSVFADSENAVRGPINEALEWYEEQGARIIEVEIPELPDLLSAAALIGHEFKPDFESYLDQFGSTDVSGLADIVANGLVHVSLSQGMANSLEREHDEEAYQAAVAARTDLLNAVERVFLDHQLDAIVYPTVRNRQVFTGEPQTGSQCQLAAHSGLPALSMPVGFSNQGLPIGMELLGMPFDDASLLAMAYPYEQQQQPRQPPSVTPPLVNGGAPPAQELELDFRSGDVRLDGQFELDVVTNLLRYEVGTARNNRAEIYAVTLVVEPEEEGERAGSVVLNLLSPATSQASGEYFMSGEFREGFNSGRVFLKVFAEGLPGSGVSQLLQ